MLSSSHFPAILKSEAPFFLIKKKTKTKILLHRAQQFFSPASCARADAVLGKYMRQWPTRFEIKKTIPISKGNR